MKLSLGKVVAALVAIAAIGVVFMVQTTDVSAQSKGKIQVTWIGHATFEVVSPGGTRILIDPFIMKNPKAPAAFKNLSRYKPTVILVSHSHGDHVADAVPIAKMSGAKVIGVSDHLRSFKDLPKKQMLGGNPGGKFKVGDVTIHLVPAMHSSTPGGRPLGFVITFADGRSLYHTGDTTIFGDMSLIQELHKPDIILLQAGGGPYNQDPQAARLAIRKYFKPKVVIPMHYGTWPILSSDEEVRKAFGSDRRVVIMKPGETRNY
jgi:L-ascorbate metabolism protein UlaG (beta-lactamase superfamily)